MNYTEKSAQPNGQRLLMLTTVSAKRVRIVKLFVRFVNYDLPPRTRIGMSPHADTHRIDRAEGGTVGKCKYHLLWSVSVACSALGTHAATVQAGGWPCAMLPPHLGVKLTPVITSPGRLNSGW